MGLALFLAPVSLLATEADCSNCQGRGPAIEASYLRTIEETDSAAGKIVDRNTGATLWRAADTAAREEASLDTSRRGDGPGLDARARSLKRALTFRGT